MWPYAAIESSVALVMFPPQRRVSGSSINWLAMTVPSATAAATAVLIASVLYVSIRFVHFVMSNCPLVEYSSTTRRPSPEPSGGPWPARRRSVGQCCRR